MFQYKLLAEPIFICTLQYYVEDSFQMSHFFNNEKYYPLLFHWVISLLAMIRRVSNIWFLDFINTLVEIQVKKWGVRLYFIIKSKSYFLEIVIMTGSNVCMICKTISCIKLRRRVDKKVSITTIQSCKRKLL